MNPAIHKEQTYGSLMSKNFKSYNNDCGARLEDVVRTGRDSH